MNEFIFTISDFFSLFLSCFLSFLSFFSFSFFSASSLELSFSAFSEADILTAVFLDVEEEEILLLLSVPLVLITALSSGLNKSTCGLKSCLLRLLDEVVKCFGSCLISVWRPNDDSYAE